MSSRAALLLLGVVVASPARAETKKSAVLVSAEGKFAIAGGSTTSGAPIVSGSAVSAGEDAHGEINLGDALVSIAPQTTFYVFGSAPPKGSKKLVVSDSTLSSGVVRVSAQKATIINTPAGKVVLAPSSEAKVHVDAKFTRVSVHKGSAKAAGATIAEGFGVRVGKKPTKLPAPPTWTAAPKLTLMAKGPGDVAVTGIATGKATQWHVQVAMNAAFTDFLVDLQLDAKSTTLVFEQKLPPGRYWTRVAAIDGDGLESTWGAVAPTEIVAKP